jgi:hypothetical protein
MTDTQDIRGAIEIKLAEVQDTSGKPEIAWENINFKPQGEAEWLRLNINFVSRKASGVGQNSQLLYEGVAFIDVFTQSDKSSYDADQLADQVMELFPYGTRLTNGSNTVIIRHAERQGALFEKPWYQVPVTIQFYSYI